MDKSEEMEFKEFQPISGGCINNGGKLSTKAAIYFIKWNDAELFPGMFEAEAKGLKQLQSANEIHIPEVQFTGSAKGYSYILMEFIEQGERRSDFFESMGYKLARLHKHTNKLFGLNHENYIGSLPQENRQIVDWPEFYIIQRLMPQIKLAIDAGIIDKASIVQFEKIYPKLEHYFPAEQPSLLHGDLWSGNYMTDELGEPCLFDPAIYYGHREMDIAMTRLFGGFNSAFYTSYQEEHPLEKGFEERVDLFKLYPLLVHLNLFGRAYWNQIVPTLRRYS